MGRTELKRNITLGVRQPTATPISNFTTNIVLSFVPDGVRVKYASARDVDGVYFGNMVVECPTLNIVQPIFEGLPDSVNSDFQYIGGKQVAGTHIFTFKDISGLLLNLSHDFVIQLEFYKHSK